ncbi:MAG: hypothetical protein JXX14_22675 [Deltaproteobacteria bacterium]|nr:hypothetical protein [Deltaproteobacteria bacterium]
MNICDVPMGLLLAHQPPIRMIDRGMAVLGNGVICESQIRTDHMFLTPAGVPAYVAVEYMAQAIGVFDGWHRYLHGQSPRIGYLVGTRELKLNCDSFVVGQVLDIEARLAWDGNSLLQFRCCTRDRATNAELATAMLNVYSPGQMDVDGGAHLEGKE